jgi:hypothetical protein
MGSRDQNQIEKLRFSPEELRTVILFWLAWSTYVLLSAVVIVALFTDWPEFLHSQSAYLK